MGGWIRISFQLSAASLLMQAFVENSFNRSQDSALFVDQINGSIYHQVYFLNSLSDH